MKDAIEVGPLPKPRPTTHKSRRKNTRLIEAIMGLGATNLRNRVDLRSNGGSSGSYCGRCLIHRQCSKARRQILRANPSRRETSDSRPMLGGACGAAGSSVGSAEKAEVPTDTQTAEPV
jgi:hypothetical protein